jgi:hypothetical protein
MWPPGTNPRRKRLGQESGFILRLRFATSKWLILLG